MSRQPQGKDWLARNCGRGTIAGAVFEEDVFNAEKIGSVYILYFVHYILLGISN